MSMQWSNSVVQMDRSCDPWLAAWRKGERGRTPTRWSKDTKAKFCCTTRPLSNQKYMMAKIFCPIWTTQKLDTEFAVFLWQFSFQVVLLAQLIIHDKTWGKKLVGLETSSLIQEWPVRDLLTVETLHPVGYWRPPERPNTPHHQEFPKRQGKKLRNQSNSRDYSCPTLTKWTVTSQEKS